MKQKSSIYLVTKSLPEQLNLNIHEQIEIKKYDIEKIIPTGYQVATETGVLIYIPFAKLDNSPVTSIIENLKITATVCALTEQQALKIAEEKMNDFIEEWQEKLRNKENEILKEEPDRW